MNRNEKLVVLASFILTLVVISLVASFLRAPTITGFITYNPNTIVCAYNSSHPDYPDWNISAVTDCTVSDGTIFLQGNLDIYGNLTLNNVKLIFNITSDGQRNIRVYSGGSLNITGGSNITTNNTNIEADFYANPGSIFEMRDSHLNEFIDIFVVTDNAIMDNNTFTYNVDHLHIANSNNSIVSNNTFFQTTGGIYLNASNFSTIYNNNISHDTGTPIAIWADSNSNKNTISKNWISNVYRGIVFQTTTNNTVFANIIQYCSDWTLILMDLADGNNITNNTMTQGTYGIYAWGGAGNTIEKNIISYNAGPGIYLANHVGGTSPRFNKIIGNEIYNNTGSGIQANTDSSNTLIENNTVYKNDNHGISSGQDNLIMQYNTVYGNADIYGIESGGDNQTVRYNIINDSEYGIYSEAFYSNISNNTVYNTTNGIYLGWTEYSNITDNIVYSNVYGLVDHEAINSTIARNTVKNNTVYGILLNTSDYPNVTYNKICYNTQGFSNNTVTNIIDNNEFCVDLLTPTSGVSVNSISNFTFNVSNPLFDSSCQVYLNGVMQAANSSVINHAESTILYSGSISTGTSYWYVYCNDSTSTNWANSSIFSFVGPICGDGTCNGDEDCTSCPDDCGACGGGGSPPAPVETPPVETPPVDETPPSETPPVETPPVETPPVKQEPQEFVYNVVNEGSSMVMDVEAKGPVQKVSVNPSSDASNVKISIGKGTEITCDTLNIQQNSKIAYNGKEKIVYTCFDISKENLDDDDIKDVEILFKVDKKWIMNKGIDTMSIELLRHHDSKWNPLLTEQVEKPEDITGAAVLESGEELEEDYFYFKATSPGLTPFVIAGLQVEPPKDCYIWIIPCWMLVWIVRITLVGLILLIIYEKRKH